MPAFAFEGFGVAGLLIAAVPVVAIVNEQLQIELARDLHGGIRAAVVDEQDEVHAVVRRRRVRRPQGLRRVVGGHDHHDLLR